MYRIIVLGLSLVLAIMISTGCKSVEYKQNTQNDTVEQSHAQADPSESQQSNTNNSKDDDNNQTSGDLNNTNTEGPQEVPDGNNVENNTDPNTVPVVVMGTQYENLGSSDLVAGWQLLKVTSSLYTTNDWNSYSSSNDNGQITFTLSFPGDWTMEGSVFYNEKGEKVGEIPPPVKLQQGQKPYDNWMQSVGFSDFYEFVGQRDFAEGVYQGTEITAKAFLDAGDTPFWYVHFYCLSHEENVVKLTLYEQSLDPAYKKTLDQIISTIRF